MTLPGTWRLGWRKKSSRLYDPCSDARLADLERRIEQFENKGWHENAAACRKELEKLRALKSGWRDHLVGVRDANLPLCLATETTITKVGKDVYVTREEAEADVALVCK
jgi:hypothetical protein